MFRTSSVHPQELLCRDCICRLRYVVIRVLLATSSWHNVVAYLLYQWTSHCEAHSRCNLYGRSFKCCFLTYKNFISCCRRKCIAADFVFLHCGLLRFTVMWIYLGVKCRSLQALLYHIAAMHLYSFYLVVFIYMYYLCLLDTY